MKKEILLKSETFSVSVSTKKALFFLFCSVSRSNSETDLQQVEMSGKDETSDLSLSDSDKSNITSTLQKTPASISKPSTSMITPITLSTPFSQSASASVPPTTVSQRSSPQLNLFPQLEQGTNVIFYIDEKEDKDQSGEATVLDPIPSYSSSVVSISCGLFSHPSPPTEDVKVFHCTNAPFQGRRDALQLKGLGTFEKPSSIVGYGTAVLDKGNQRAQSFVMPGSKGSSSLSKEAALKMLETEMFAVPLRSDMMGLITSIFEGSELQFTQSGTPGVSGRSRFEGVLTEGELIRHLLNFARAQGLRLELVTSALLFSYYSQEALNSLIQAADNNLPSLPGNVSASVVASLAVLKEAASVPQRILPHGDYKAMIGVRMMKAIFSANTSGEDSFWDFYLDEGTFLCTLKIPNNSCLLISDYALGMLYVSYLVESL